MPKSSGYLARWIMAHKKTLDFVVIALCSLIVAFWFVGLFGFGEKIDNTTESIDSLKHSMREERVESAMRQWRHYRRITPTMALIRALAANSGIDPNLIQEARAEEDSAESTLARQVRELLEETAP